jgi:hypothetical protein
LGVSDFRPAQNPEKVEKNDQILCVKKAAELCKFEKFIEKKRPNFRVFRKCPKFADFADFSGILDKFALFVFFANLHAKT